ncbi:MAG: thymidine kinase [Waddliaceae bacterium]|nr:thymidine kinase [Waddliaceae bacterium]
MQDAGGRLEVICGSMFSGKTEELMRRLRRAEYARQNVLTVKHSIDDRKSYACIVSHDGSKREAHAVDDTEGSLSQIIKLATDEIDVIGIDEIQFFPEGALLLIQALLSQGKRVIVSGLDLNFRKEPFGVVPDLMAMADDVQKLRAICMACGAEANFTQRLVNGAPAHYDEPEILVGAEECYEARCRNCHELPGEEEVQELIFASIDSLAD